MRIQHNIMAMSAYRNYTNNVAAMKKNLEKLSSGYKINRAGDDAAGLAISEKMRAQITGLETAQKNAKDGISLVQTAEGALTEVHDMLNRMVELATQSANGTYDNTTDRAQMQKEVNQLLSEINRIADSSNFNGINLLDGTLGLNTDAFSFAGVAAQEATDGTIDMSKYLAPSSAKPNDLHLEESAKAGKDPSFKIDLGDLSVKVDGKGTGSKATAKVSFNILGKDYEVELENTGSNAKTFSTAQIAAELAKKLGTHTTSGAVAATSSTGTAIRIGDALFGITAGAETSLSYLGSFDGTTFTDKSATTGDFTQEHADAINKLIGGNVDVKGITGAGTKTGDVVHDVTKVEQAVAKKDATLAGIDMKLDLDIVTQGGTITIDGKTFTFETKDSTNTASTVINLAGLDKSEWVHAAVDKLSKVSEFTGADGRKWKIGSKNGDTIHIEQTSKTTTAGKELDSYKELTDLISAKGEAKTANNAGTKITINDAEVQEGNTLNIDGKKYQFTDDKNKVGKTENDITYVAIKGGAAKNLQAAIGGTSKFDADENSVTVYAANAEDNAPTVLGKGLTLQIGDTSDSYNQLNVAVQDMHAKSLGIDGLNIASEEAAQAATDKIKAAINTVSDVRGTLGATQNRLDHTINNLSVMTENIQDAESTIRDVDVAEEMMAYTKNNILIQSAQAMLAQANQVPQGVLQLLQ